MGRIVIAAATSGSGKTTVACGIMAALRRRGLRVQPFKAGPDYIDPSYQTRAASRPARNLDGWLLEPRVLKELYARAAGSADVAVVEGFMGLFDGRGATGEGSTAELAKLLETPVIVVIDVGKVSRTAAAIALGCQRFDTDLPLAGFILNRVASSYHYDWTAGPIAEATGLPVFGYLPERAELAVPERHLGLVPTAESPVGDGFFERLAAQVEQSIDLDKLVATAEGAARLEPESTGVYPIEPAGVRTRIGVARDEAFSFYYEDNLDLLRAWGAEVVPFSPLHDRALPTEIDGLYIGGGFPEVYARELAANREMLEALRAAAAAEIPIYAECGGLMFLSAGIVDFEGKRHPLAGLIPAWSVLEQPRLSIGYRTGAARTRNLLLEQGEQVRGHEFHWSQLTAVSPETAAYDLETEEPRIEGYVSGNLLATYLHVHFGSRRDLAPRLVEACVAARERRVGST